MNLDVYQRLETQKTSCTDPAYREWSFRVDCACGRYGVLWHTFSSNPGADVTCPGCNREIGFAIQHMGTDGNGRQRYQATAEMLDGSAPTLVCTVVLGREEGDEPNAYMRPSNQVP